MPAGGEGAVELSIESLSEVRLLFAEADLGSGYVVRSAGSQDVLFAGSMGGDSARVFLPSGAYRVELHGGSGPSREVAFDVAPGTSGEVDLAP